MKKKIYQIKKNTSLLRGCLIRKHGVVLSFFCLFFLLTTTSYAQTMKVSGVVREADSGLPLLGATLREKDTSNGAITDMDGMYSLEVSEGAVLVASFIGYKTKEITLINQTVVDFDLDLDVTALEELVVVGYGVQKKSNITSAVSTVDAKVFENRPTANAFRSMQGAAPGLQITNSSAGGEPGAPSSINIRGIIAGNSGGGAEAAQPLVLVDGVRMDLNNVNPNDIKSISVLKDAASASIYGSQAAGGVILVTTKSGGGASGKVQVNYSNSFSISRPTIWPESASPIDFAYAVNDSRINNNQAPYHDDEDLANILANMENPGSAPSIEANAAGTNWSYTSIGIDATGATDWQDVYFKDWASRSKHDLSISGGTEDFNYYLSVGAYDEGGLLAVGDESFKRYNFNAKMSGKVNNWLTLELNTKYRKSNSDFPIEAGQGTVARSKSRVFDLLSKLKPTLPQYDPIYGTELLQHSYYSFWDGQRATTDNNQIILAPKIIINPLEGLVINAQFNYRRDNNLQEMTVLSSQLIRPEGLVDKITQEATTYSPTFTNTEYSSPNVYATYNKSISDHNFELTAGYQSELTKQHNISANGQYLISNNFVSLSTAIDLENQEVDDFIQQFSVQSGFGRLRYNYKEKYLIGGTVRRDGSSFFAPGLRTVNTASVEAGYNIASEDFWPLKDHIGSFKLSASYGILPNQNIAQFQYLSLINNENLTNFLFDGQQEIRAIIPGLTTQSLTWEENLSTNVGLDIGAFKDKLNVGLSWYRIDTEGFTSLSEALPAQLGTTAPLTNGADIRVQGWEFEASWRQQLGDFGYSIRGVLSDYKQTVLDYPNEGNSLASAFYDGQDIGEIRGLTWDGWWMTDEEYGESGLDQSFVAGSFWAGDTRYADLNEDGVINNGENTAEDNGDFSVIGNSTPRYQYSVTLGLTYKNFDLSAFIQGVGKRDVLVSTNQIFRGPAQGAFHANVWEEHLDYFRAEDTESPLGPNTDAYFPAPYSANPGNNNRNYRYAVDRYIQNGAYVRLKSLQIGYTIPVEITEKVKINNFRIYATAENLFTITDLLFFDPEVVTGGNDLVGSAQSYPLSQMFSAGINVSF